ncbi:MAG: cupin domain-containing protein [candidate division Zixibacteria bacterium]|nr:cupin domain-containing protein [candidate division Zixibacteria bacterium]MDH3937211.1 cupin domain-containing protein [candidate division Zixibacteria bacterium]MDH4032668.1 cupin domain-containing protein [candidate division Zixibacteria bacterium]
MPDLTADKIIELLNLKPLPLEGGFYRETYRSDDIINHAALPERFPDNRSLSTAIYYLLTPETFSAMHRLPADEMFHFYLGDPVTMLQLHPNGSSGVLALGRNLATGQSLQALVPHGAWQGARLVEGGRYALLGTTVAPGFEFDDYEAGHREQLIRQYPDRSELITLLTKA